MHKYNEILRECELFLGIPSKELAGILQCLGGRVVQTSAQEIILQEGEPARQIGIVLDGAVQIAREDFYGNRSIVARIEAGQLFAETFICGEIKVVPVSVVSECESEVLLIDGRRILNPCDRACKFHTALINNLLRIVSKKNLLLNKKLEIVSKRTTREKLMAYLLSEAKTNQSRAFTIPYDRQALADYLGVERSAMSAEISRLQKDGILISKRSFFRLL